MNSLLPFPTLVFSSRGFDTTWCHCHPAEGLCSPGRLYFLLTSEEAFCRVQFLADSFLSDHVVRAFWLQRGAVRSGTVALLWRLSLACCSEDLLVGSCQMDCDVTLFLYLGLTDLFGNVDVSHQIWEVFSH